MDSITAQRIRKELMDRCVGGWLIHNYRGNGKSAVVFEAEKDGNQAALKVFDRELVERYGKGTQLGRIERERSLIGEHHTHLVQIFDGGECEDSGYLYVAMELIDAPNLRDSLDLVPREKIGPLLHQIASAARFLEERSLAHRDIKPENVAVLPDFSKAVLLDLGVLRPFGDGGLTDDDARGFVGTLRYSSPEFLLRTETDTCEGWRAVTFYQLGAILHDLIMRRPLFDEFSEPYAKLVEAVQSKQPLLHADDVSADLIRLARNCLVKDPEDRLSLVSWEDFDCPSTIQLPADVARENIKKRALIASRQRDRSTTYPQATSRQILQRIVNRLDRIIRLKCTGNELFPPVEIVPIMNNQTQINVLFPASHDHSLSQKLSIRFDCELVDEEIMAVSVSASACLLPTHASHDAPPSPVNVFRGPLDSDSLTEPVHTVLWCGLSLAQLQEVSANAADNICWLDLAHELEGRK